MRAGRDDAVWVQRGALALMLVAAGCAEPTTGQVAGTVAVDGQPAKTGSIAFFPVDGRGTTAGGEIIDGQYIVEAALGEVKVEIRVPKVVGEAKLYDTPNSPVQPILAEKLPDKYNDQTELRLEVKPGKNRQDYNLSTK